MRDSMAPVINGYDCSGAVNRYSLKCEPFYVDGGNGGTLLDGSTVSDVLSVKLRFSWAFNSLSAQRCAELTAALDAGEAPDTATAYVFDPTRNSVLLAEFHVTRPIFQYAFAPGGQPMSYAGETLVLEESDVIGRFVFTPPTRTRYDVGDALDLSGVAVTQYDRDGVASDITADCSFDPPAGALLASPGAVPVSVLLPVGMTAGTFAVNVTAVTYTVTPPTKTSYEMGEPLDLAGVAVTRLAVSGEADVTADCAFDPANGALLLNIGSAPVGVSLGGEPIGQFFVSVVVPSEIIASGYWWTLFATGLLDIICQGDMPYNVYYAPWSNYRLQITSVTIHDSVTNIGQYAFNNCAALTSITIPDSIRTISTGAFSDCYSLTSVTIPDSVKSIGAEAFAYSGLTSVTIPDSVRSIGGKTFINCPLTSVTIPDSVRSIGVEAFRGCRHLNSVTIPDSVTNIEVSAFNGCEALTSVYYGGSQEQWDAIVIGEDNAPLYRAAIHYNSAGPDETQGGGV